MNIQIFGSKKCRDTRAAERFFKERRIKYQFIDLPRYSMSRGEFDAIRRVLSLEEMVDEKSRAYEECFIAHLAYESDKIEKLLENPNCFRTPFVRNGKQVTVGNAPEVWKSWQ